MDCESLFAQSGSLETVRALHQTIVALRTALEASKNEILELKQKSWPIESVQNTLTSLSIENHALKQQILESYSDKRVSFDIEELSENQKVSESQNKFSDETVRDLKGESPRDFKQIPQVGDKKNNLGRKINDNSEEIQDIKVYNLGREIDNSLQSHGVDTFEDKRTERTTDFGLTERENNTQHGQVQFCSVSNQIIPKRVKIVSPKEHINQKPTKRQIIAEIKVSAKNSGKNKSKSLESLTVLKSPVDKKFTFTKTISFSNLSVHREYKNCSKELADSETEMDDKIAESNNRHLVQDLTSQSDFDQEVDDIELIFTTEDTDDTKDFREELVPIDERESNSNLLQMPLSDYEQVSDRELDDDVFNDNENQSFDGKRDNSIFNSKSDNSINHDEKSIRSYFSYQDSSFEKSFENKSLEKDESFDRFEERIRIVETDISKIGIQEMDYVGVRRNTCPNPIQYRPLPHRDVIAKGMSSRKPRPILTHSNAIRRESEAQTDISAVPGTSWRSESSLAHKIKGKLGDNFTTLPSKIPMPGSRLRLSEKTVEARRVLLSDIGFTSMVPELSRSADHLCPGDNKPPTVTTYGQFLRATDLYSPNCASQKFNWTARTTTPSDVSQTQSRYSSVYPLYSPPAPSRRCSAPVSPSRRALSKHTTSKVRFANGSLPELRTDWSTVDSGDSTDSLVEEAENYLRRSIDCIATGRDTTCGYSEQRRLVPRRASAPEPCRDNVPPMGWQPFLPRLPRDLKHDNWVKVITPEGRVRGGRVRFVGLIASQGQDYFIGVQLTCPEGVNDGTWGHKRYFQCEPLHGIFVPFKKVVMGWRP